LLHKIITLNFLLGGILTWFPLKIHNTVEKYENVTAKFVWRFRCTAARLWRKQVNKNNLYALKINDELTDSPVR
jgi:hypothetical protein